MWNICVMTDLDKIDEFATGDEIILDNHEEPFVVLRKNPNPAGGDHLVGLTILDEDLNKYELRKVQTSENFFELNPEGEGSPVRHVPDRGKIKNVEKVGENMQLVHEWQEEMYS